MKTVKTAKGRIIDIYSLASKNEQARAVSNVPINARGDIIDSRGNVKMTREETTKQSYRDAAPTKTTNVGLGEEMAPWEIEKKNKANKAKPNKDGSPKEINRELRTRKDESQYIEVEYDDGSMQEIEVDKK